MYQSVFGRRYINGFEIDFFGWDAEKERIEYISGGKVRTAKRNFPRWALRLHGNTPPGVLLSWYNIILPNGKKARYSIYN